MNPDDYVARANQNTCQRVKQWHYATKAVEIAKAQLAKADAEQKMAEHELGKWIVPDEGKILETFNIWFGSGVLAAFKCGNIDSPEYRVSWRVAPSQKQLEEM